MSRLSGKDIIEIARLLDESRFASLDLQMGEFRLRIRRDGSSGEWDDEDAQEDRPVRRRKTRHAPPPELADEPDGDADVAETDTPPAAVAATAAAADELDVPAPLLGNFYTAPRPGDPPFVQPGDRVEPDTTIGIIEVMKLMNPIRAGVSGTVVGLLAENGKAVEEGQPLLRVKAD